MPKKLES